VERFFPKTTEPIHKLAIAILVWRLHNGIACYEKEAFYGWSRQSGRSRESRAKVPTNEGGFG